MLNRINFKCNFVLFEEEETTLKIEIINGNIDFILTT